MKKFLKWIAIAFAVVMIVLITAPFLFKNKIKQMVVAMINDNVEAVVDFEDVNLNFLKSFPLTSVSIEKLSIINKEPFLGDTLIYSNKIDLKISIKELFKSEKKPISIEKFFIKDTQINIIFNKEGFRNFDIAKKNDSEEKEKQTELENSNFSLKIQSYGIENMKVTYFDQASSTKAVLDCINHKGKGDFANSIVDLETYTTTNISFEMEGTNYLNNVNLVLDAVLNLDLENSKYTFKENMLRINKLPLEFDGFVQILEKEQHFNLTFNTPTTSFSNFLGLIPSVYSQSIENVKTTGEFSVKGFAKGMLSETTIPQFDITMNSKNASFKYPDLPKSVQNITIEAKIKNQTGFMKDIYFDLDELSFKIDQDEFNAKAKLHNLTENILVDANLNGTINLANLSQAYPIELEQKLKGIISANVGVNLDMLSVEQEKYENINAEGSFVLTDFEYTGEELTKPLTISQTDLTFNPLHVSLNKFSAKTGRSDVEANGTLDNFYGFLFKNQTLKGRFNLSSNHLEISDFMTTSTENLSKETEQTENTISESIKIPSFLNCSISVKADSVVYDNLTLKDVSGKLEIKDETVSLQHVVTSIFDGKIVLNGSVSTKEEAPLFVMDLNLNNLDIAQSFTQLDMLGKIAPIAKVISGKINSYIQLNGMLDAKEFTPDLNSLRGDLLGQLLETKVDKDKSNLLTSLDSNLNFIDFDKLNINKLKIALNFENGKVNLQPVDLKYEDISIRFSGTHGFDQLMNYTATFDVPAKHFGKEVTSLLANLSGNQANTMSIPVKASITGDFSNPKVQTDIKQAVSNLTNQIIEKQKNDLINKGKDAVQGAIKDKIGKDVDIPTSKEDVKQKIDDKKEDVKQKVEDKKEELKEEAKDKVKGAVKDLFKKKK